MAFGHGPQMPAGAARWLAGGATVVLTLLVIFGAACQPYGAPSPTATHTPAPSSTAPQPTPGQAPVEVEISGFAFVPATITVAVGSTVTWTNQDSVPHTVTSDAGIFDSVRLGRDGSFSYSFAERGTFSYHCAVHPYMKAKVVVE
ncbi:MAG: cupredoxin family copper-binding protein [Chloroflexi bacterium]|nr:cupredoxin family copper-binding protein [Chloroflexota bacterium]